MRELHLLLLRHGQTDANATGVLQGQKPTALNELGRQQADQLATRIAAWRPSIDAIVSSDLPRAVQTAEPIAAACQVPLLLDAGWRERGFGEMEGKTVGERNTWRAATGEVDAPGAEPFAAFQERVRRAILHVGDHAPRAAIIAVVTHGGPCRAVLGMLADGRLPLADGQPTPAQAPIINCAIMYLVTWSDLWRVSCVNDAAHLTPTEPTDHDLG